MTLPVLRDFTAGAATVAADVQANDADLANTFGAIDIATNVSNDNAPMLIGPIRVTIKGSQTIYRWTAPVAVELWELHVSPMSAVDGTTTGATLDGTHWRQIGVYNDDVLVGSLAEPKSLTTSYTVSLSGESNRTVGVGDDIKILATGGAGADLSLKYHANVSILAYTKHRE